MRKWIARLLALSALSSAALSSELDAQMANGWRDGDRGSALDARPGAGPRGGDRFRDPPRPDRPGRPDLTLSDRGDAPRGDRAGGPDRGGPDRAGPDQGRPDRDRQDWDRPDRDGPGRGGSDGRPDPASDRGRPGRDPSAWSRQRDEGMRRRLDRRDDRWARADAADRAGWNRGWRGDDRYDWASWRTAHRGAYRLPRYDAPGGWGYRRVAIGAGLQPPLWSRDRWIADPYSYRLPDAYGPYRWIRYYDDALLVDLASGRVVDAVYGIFW